MKKICKLCRGSGHDPAGRPVIKREIKQTPTGTTVNHITMKCGSGCLKCLGLGVERRD